MKYGTALLSAISLVSACRSPGGEIEAGGALINGPPLGHLDTRAAGTFHVGTFHFGIFHFGTFHVISL